MLENLSEGLPKSGMTVETGLQWLLEKITKRIIKSAQLAGVAHDKNSHYRLKHFGRREF